MPFRRKVPHINMLQFHTSRVVRKPAFCICENKVADQLRGNCEADQRLYLRYTDSTMPLLPKSKFSGLSAFSVTAQPSLCRTRSETPKTGFLRTRIIHVPATPENTMFLVFCLLFALYNSNRYIVARNLRVKTYSILIFHLCK